MKILIISLLLIFSSHVFGQKGDNECRRIYKDAIALTKKNNYQMALNKFNAARACDPLLTRKVDSGILEVFKLIEGEKEEAIRQKRIANKQTKIADEQTRIAKEQSLLAKSREKDAKDLLLKAELAKEDAKNAWYEAEKEKVIAIKNDSLAQISRKKSKHNEMRVWANYYDNKNKRLSINFNLEAMKYGFSQDIVTSIRSTLSNTTSSYCNPFYESKDSIRKVWAIEEEEIIITLNAHDLLIVFNIDGGVTAPYKLRQDYE